ncbi:enhancer of mRNA-decapping protein 4 isoform X2 [Lingula anatina]|uniref:Enhancer of mRNA-decapping protein 4 isoform X2 n=1 Tax=Lingula anatina TaxID=7574 RepID=A0A1S3H024_LINAN|nr:enhancer of mRNA-decapping protein 4 isoform X2 [Lingula anatina]|eukprot:XP_013379353.1 enhancer of mRNA-decapping protein 4 isoform X2 [Lingula anatina]
METSSGSSSFNTTEASQLLKDILQGNTGVSSISSSVTDGDFARSARDISGESGASFADAVKAHLPKQQIILQGNDSANSFSVYGRDVSIIASQASGAAERVPASNKVKITPMVNFEWEPKYYIGNLVAIHRDGIHMSYVLTGKSGGCVRVINRKTAERALLKGFTGRVMDVAFAHHTLVIIAAVDEMGNLFVHQADDTDDGKILTACLLHVVRPAETPPSSYHRVIWCPYIPDEEEEQGTEDMPTHDAGKLLVVTHDEKAELWSVDMVNGEYGTGPHRAEDIDIGFLAIENHTRPIVDAAFSPDGTALATASLDGQVKFFQVYMQDKATPRCLHEWKPHDGLPLSSLFFLDDHKNPKPEVQFWKFALTGANDNRELKIWSCESWTCLQTLRFVSPPDLPSNFQVEPSLKACLDLSANYMVLADTKRKVLNVLQLYQDAEHGTAHVSSVSEFLLTQPCLSMAILEAGSKVVKKSSTQEQSGEMNSGNLDEDEDDEDQEARDEDGIKGCLVRLYTVQHRALQELQIHFELQTSVPNLPAPSISSISQDGTALRDALTDISMDTVTSLSDVEYKAKDAAGNNSQPLLLTPDAFTSSPRKSSESLHSSNTSSSFTHVSALNEEHGASVMSPSSSVTLTPNSSHVPTPTTLPLPPVTPGEENRLTTTPKHTPQHTPKLNLSAAEQDLDDFLGSPTSTSSSIKGNQPPSFQNGGIKVGDRGGGQGDMLDELFGSQGTKRQHLQSSSSSTTSIEVGQIMDAKPSYVVGETAQEEEEEEEEEEGEEEEEEEEQHSYGMRVWPQAPKVTDEGQEKGDGTEDQDEDVKIEEETEEHTGRTDSSSEREEISSSSESPKKKSHRHPSTRQRTSSYSPTSARSLEAGSIPQLQDTMQNIMSLLQDQRQELASLKAQLHQQREHNALMEGVLGNRLETALEQYGHSQDLRLREALSSTHSARQHDSHQVVNTLSEALVNKVIASLDTAVKTEIKNSVVPTIQRMIHPLQEHLHREMAQKLTATDSVMKDNIGKMVRSKQTVEAIGQAAGQAVSGTVISAYRETFQNTILPGFERSCQHMTGQLNEAFHKGTQEYVQQLQSQMDSVNQRQNETKDYVRSQLQAAMEQFKSSTQSVQQRLVTSVQTEVNKHLQQTMSGLEEAMITRLKSTIRDEVSDALRDQQERLNESIAQAMRSTAATPVPGFVDPQQQQAAIHHLLKQGQLNNAFQQALSASDLSLVMYVCETVNPSQVFNQTPCPLQQPVLLSLIQQLSADLGNNTELKHKYLEEAVMNLEPTNSLTREHMPAVLNNLVQKLLEYINANPTDRMTRQLRMLLMASQSLLK